VLGVGRSKVNEGLGGSRQCGHVIVRSPPAVGPQFSASTRRLDLVPPKEYHLYQHQEQAASSRLTNPSRTGW